MVNFVIVNGLSIVRRLPIKMADHMARELKMEDLPQYCDFFLKICNVYLSLK